MSVCVCVCIACIDRRPQAISMSRRWHPPCLPSAKTRDITSLHVRLFKSTTEYQFRAPHDALNNAWTAATVKACQNLMPKPTTTKKETNSSFNTWTEHIVETNRTVKEPWQQGTQKTPGEADGTSNNEPGTWQHRPKVSVSQRPQTDAGPTSTAAAFYLR